MKKLLTFSILLICLTASNKTFSAQKETKYRWVEFREGFEHGEGEAQFDYISIVQDGITIDQINAKIEDLLKLMNHTEPVINCLILHNNDDDLGYLDNHDFQNKETDTLITLDDISKRFSKITLPKSVFILRINGNDIETFSFNEPYEVSDIEKKLQNLSKADNSNTIQIITRPIKSPFTNTQKKEEDSVNASQSSTTSNSSNMEQNDNSSTKNTSSTSSTNNTSNATNQYPLTVVGLTLVGVVLVSIKLAWTYSSKSPHSSKSSKKKNHQ